MRSHWINAFVLVASCLAATAGVAQPPDHAPAHGQRAKHDEPSRRAAHSPGEFEIVFDSERGISIAVGFPGVYVEAGQFYRQHDGKWQVSLRADGGWKERRGQCNT